MARPLRIQFAGALYHVISRGNQRRPIVLDTADREKRLDWLRRTVETYAWRLHAFAQLGNHEHLFVETPEPNLAAGITRPARIANRHPGRARSPRCWVSRDAPVPISALPC